MSRRQRTPLTKSQMMARIRRIDTVPEMLVRRALWGKGIRYRVGLRIEGVRPDITFPRQKVCVFIDGCFWHACPTHGTLPASNTQFWSQKLEKNVARDQRQTTELLEAGWRVLRFWEHEAMDCLPQVVASIQFALIPIEPRPTERINCVED